MGAPHLPSEAASARKVKARVRARVRDRAHLPREAASVRKGALVEVALLVVAPVHVDGAWARVRVRG